MASQKTPKTILVIFIMLLIAPMTAKLFNIAPFSQLTENRTLVEKPKINLTLADLQEFPRKYKKYFNDNFGLRSLLIKGNTLLRYGLLGISTSSQVVNGKNGWLYFSNNGELDDSRGITHFTEEQLQKWTIGLLLKREWLRQRGIHYLFIIAPNKSTIYREFLPAGYGKVRNGTGLDDFYSYIKKYTDLEVLDLRPSLIASKSSHTLYSKTDTHWNNYGAFLAYQEITRHLEARFPSVRMLKLEDFNILPQKVSAGDLVGMMGGLEYLHDKDYAFTPKEPFKAKQTEENKLRPRDHFTMETGEVKLPRAVIFRDSFFNNLTPFVAENFNVSHFLWARWNSKIQVEEMFTRYRPHIVIEEVVERLIKDEESFLTAEVPSYIINSNVSEAISTGKHEIFDLNKVTAISQANLKHTDVGLSIEATGSDPQLLLPINKFSATNYRAAVLRIDIESPHETQIQLFYKTSKKPDYSEDQSTSIHLKKGHNQLDLLIRSNDMTGQMRLDPAGIVGRYVIKKLSLYPMLPPNEIKKVR